jgi:hypothetical protein
VSSLSAEIDPIAEHQWTNRLLLVFSVSGSNEDIRSFRRLLAESACDLEDRDLVVGWIPMGEPASFDSRDLSAEEAASLRSRFDVTPVGQVVILIGKDGGVKARYEQAPKLDEVFALIDGMPMRRAEMRSNAPGCGDRRNLAP